jgi:hypothetical protein
MSVREGERRRGGREEERRERGGEEGERRRGGREEGEAGETGEAGEVGGEGEYLHYRGGLYNKTLLVSLSTVLIQ